MNRLPADKRFQVVAALVEGTSINATCRMTGAAKHTVLKLLKDMGCAAAAYHNSHVRNLRVRRVQADEIWAFVYGKDKNLTLEQVFVERHNLSMRMGMRRFTRLTNAFSKKLENHGHAVALYFMHYNFCRVHKTLRVTPAMEAGLTDHVWTMEELLGILNAKPERKDAA